LKAIQAPLYLHELVKRVYIMAMDGGEKEAVRASILVAHLHDVGYLPRHVLKYGLYRMLEAADDLMLDVPHAPSLAARFCLEAVKNGCVEKDFMETAPEKVKDILDTGKVCSLERTPS
jgi:hypothetical protein